MLSVSVGSNFATRCQNLQTGCRRRPMIPPGRRLSFATHPSFWREPETPTDQLLTASIQHQTCTFSVLSLHFFVKTHPKLAPAEGGRERGRSKTIDGTSAILWSDRLPTGPVIPAAAAERIIFPRGLLEAATRAVLAGVAVYPKKRHSRHSPFQTLWVISDFASWAVTSGVRDITG